MPKENKYCGQANANNNIQHVTFGQVRRFQFLNFQ